MGLENYIETFNKVRYNKAKKYTIDTIPPENKIMLYSDVYVYNEGYFSKVEDFINYCKEKNIEIPDYIWGTQEIPLTLDAYEIVEDACQELWEGAYESIDSKDIAELQSYLDEWTSKQTSANSYVVDYNYCILLNKGESEI